MASCNDNQPHHLTLDLDAHAAYLIGRALMQYHATGLEDADERRTALLLARSLRVSVEGGRRPVWGPQETGCVVRALTHTVAELLSQGQEREADACCSVVMEIAALYSSHYGGPVPTT